MPPLNPTTRKSSGKLEVTLRVLVPMDPVEPRTDITFIRTGYPILCKFMILADLGLQCHDLSSRTSWVGLSGTSGRIEAQQINIEHRECEEQAIDSVQDAAMSGYEVGAVLDVGGPFQHRFGEVAELTEHAQQK